MPGGRSARAGRHGDRFHELAIERTGDPAAAKNLRTARRACLDTEIWQMHEERSHHVHWVGRNALRADIEILVEAPLSPT